MVGKGKRELEILGHVEYPYNVIAMNNSSTKVTAEQLYSEYDTLLLLATEENMEYFSKNGTVFESNNMLLCFENDATDAQVDAVLNCWKKYGTYTSKEEIVQHSREVESETLKTFLPLPATMLVFVTISYIGMVVMLLSKKKTELSIMSLCGASRRLCTEIVVWGNLWISIIPAVIMIGFIKLAPTLDWYHIIDLEGYKIGNTQIFLVLGYLLLTVVISILGTSQTIKKCAPISLYREIDE